MDVAVAKRISDAVDAEFARRRRGNGVRGDSGGSTHVELAHRLHAAVSAEQERRWLAEDGGLAGLAWLTGHLGCLLDELEQPMNAGQVECDDGQGFDDLAARLDDLAEKLDLLAAREAEEAAGVENRVRLATLVRPQHKREQPPSSPVRTLLPTCR